MTNLSNLSNRRFAAHRLPLFCFAFSGGLSLVSHSAIADMSISHSISADIETYDQTLFAANREFRYEPVGGSLGYGLTVNQQWQISLSYGHYEDELSAPAFTSDFRNQSIGGLLGYTTALWWFTVSYQSDQDEIEVQSNREAAARIDNELTLAAAAFDVSREVTLSQNSWLDVALSIEYQQQRYRVNAMGFYEGSRVAEQTTLDSDGWLAGLTLSSGYFHSLSDTSALVPVFSMNWSEPVSGDTHGSTVRRVRTPSGRQAQQITSNQLDNGEGSGNIDFSISWLLSNVTLNGGISLPFDSDLDTSRMDDGKRLWIGIRYSID